MVSRNYIYLESDTDVSFVGMRDSRSRDYIEDATAVFTVRGADGEVIAGLEDLPMEYQEDSRGIYIGVIPQSASLDAGGFYHIEIRVSAPGSRDLLYKAQAQAIYAGTER